MFSLLSVFICVRLSPPFYSLSTQQIFTEGLPSARILPVQIYLLMIDIREEKLKTEWCQSWEGRAFHFRWSGRFFQTGTCNPNHVGKLVLGCTAGPLRLGYVWSIQEVSRRPEWLERICEGEMRSEATVSSVKGGLCLFLHIGYILDAEHGAWPMEGVHLVLVEWTRATVAQFTECLFVLMYVILTVVPWSCKSKWLEVSRLAHKQRGRPFSHFRSAHPSSLHHRASCRLTASRLFVLTQDYSFIPEKLWNVFSARLCSRCQCQMWTEQTHCPPEFCPQYRRQ